MENNEDWISLHDILGVLKKYFILIVLISLMGLFLSYVYTTYFIIPKYTSSAELIVQAEEKNSSNLQSDINANVLLINTYKDMILGKIILTEVSKDLSSIYGYKLSSNELREMISVNQSSSSMIFQIQSISSSPEKSARIVNTTAKIFQKRAKEVLDVNKVTITSEGEIPIKPSSPKVQQNLFIGIILGFFIGIILSFILNLFDNRVKSDLFIRNELELPVIGMFSILTSKDVVESNQLLKSLRMPDVNIQAKVYKGTSKQRRDRERV